MKIFLYRVLIAAIIGISGSVLSVMRAEAEHNHPSRCEQSAQRAYVSSVHAAFSDYWLAIGKAKHLPTRQEREEARKIAKEERDENLELAKEQRAARRELCEALDETFYHPVINPDDFVDVIDNPYLPLTPGTIHFFQKETEEGEIESIRVEVTDQTKEILGVMCTVVRDTVYLDGEVIEDTLDWFAQDVQGNVWYFGEHSEEFEDGVLVALEGSWIAGEDGAKPGIVMQANPVAGVTYRQEFLLGEAEDAAQVISLDESESVPYGDFNGLLQTRDFSPLEPDHEEFKYYHPGTGLILEVDPESGERTELIAICDDPKDADCFPSE